MHANGSVEMDFDRIVTEVHLAPATCYVRLVVAEDVASTYAVF
jgi:hypothetical protein